MASSASAAGPTGLTPVSEVLSRLVAGCAPVPTQRVALSEAAGRVLSEPIVAQQALPSCALALRAGWALSSAEVIGASAYAPAILARQPLWVEPGSELPAGTDAVLPPDALSQEAGLIMAVASAAPGESVRRIGEEVSVGAVLRDAAERVRPTDLAVLRALSVETCAVRDLAVTLLAGPEADPVAELLAQFAVRAGASVSRNAMPQAPSDMAKALPHTEGIVVILGGSEAFRSAALGFLEQGGSLVARALALRPGEDSACALWRGRPVIMTSARLDAVLAIMLAVLMPCLDRLLQAKPWRAEIAGRLTRKISSSVGLTDLALLRRAEEELEPLSVGEITLGALARADAWLAVPPESEGYPAGASVRAIAI